MEHWFVESKYALSGSKELENPSCPMLKSESIRNIKNSVIDLKILFIFIPPALNDNLVTM